MDRIAGILWGIALVMLAIGFWSHFSDSTGWAAVIMAVSCFAGVIAEVILAARR